MGFVAVCFDSLFYGTREKQGDNFLKEGSRELIHRGVVSFSDFRVLICPNYEIYSEAKWRIYGSRNILQTDRSLVSLNNQNEASVDQTTPLFETEPVSQTLLSLPFPFHRLPPPFTGRSSPPSCSKP
ncbi:hypothetical protein L596_025447 [Steinernema carpocapsae]|uniref:Uncharacterized protein n=1 Tax=Steinernema carpocapsae TaxID=34508 RepID=A0A4U5M7Z5_STECR|nr:hypothetical protein L596_025447 [Steinernema carpocapsae]